jgi:hypothetical protein
MKQSTACLPEVTCMKSENESKLAYENGFDQILFKKKPAQASFTNCWENWVTFVRLARVAV